MRKRKGHSLVCQYVQNVSRAVLEKCQGLIRRYVRGRQGVYALYRRDRLYYVGLASNLRGRLSNHLRDRRRQDVQGWPGLVGDDLQVRLSHVAADELQRGGPLAAEYAEEP